MPVLLPFTKEPVTVVGNTRIVGAILACVFIFKSRSFVLSPFTALFFCRPERAPLSPLPMDTQHTPQMDNSTFMNHPGPHMIDIGGTVDFEVTDQLDGRSLISGLWKTFFTSDLAQDGDRFVYQSLSLFQRHLKLMSLQDQDTIWESLDKLVSGNHIAQSISKLSAI